MVRAEALRSLCRATAAGPRSLSWAVLTYRDPMTRPGPPPPRGRHSAPDGDARPDQAVPAGRHAAPDPPQQRHAAPEQGGSAPPPGRRHAAPDDSPYGVPDAAPNGVTYHRPILGNSLRQYRPDPYSPPDANGAGHLRPGTESERLPAVRCRTPSVGGERQCGLRCERGRPLRSRAEPQRLPVPPRRARAAPVRPRPERVRRCERDRPGRRAGRERVRGRPPAARAGS